MGGYQKLAQRGAKWLPFTTYIHRHACTASHSRTLSGGNAFADLLDDDDEVDEPAPAPSKSKKKKKEKAAKSAFSGLMSDDEADEDSTMAPEAAESEINLVTTPVDSLASIEQVTAALACTGISKTRKQGLKQRLKKLEVRCSGVATPCSCLRACGSLSGCTRAVVESGHVVHDVSCCCSELE